MTGKVSTLSCTIGFGTQAEWMRMWDQMLREDVAKQLKSNVDAGAHTPAGKEWVRGWDDWRKPSQAAPEQPPT